ncbi:MAG: hypothetical protein IKI91_01915 [Clostridia bacterium]|nr:hypothetical protein [Clostridia bacterium]
MGDLFDFLDEPEEENDGKSFIPDSVTIHFEKNEQDCFFERNAIEDDKTVSSLMNTVDSSRKAERIDKLFCRKCGAELFLDSVYCHRCGEKVLFIQHDS